MRPKAMAFSSRRDFASRLLPFHVLVNPRNGGIKRILVDIVHHHVITRQCHHLRDTIAHLACADDAD